MKAARRHMLAGSAAAFAVALFAFVPIARTARVSAALQPRGHAASDSALVKGDFNVRTLDDSALTVPDGLRRYAYQVWLPRDYDPSRRWPVIIALHGSEERGSDNRRQVDLIGVGPVLRQGVMNVPAIVVFPQNPMGMRGSSFSTIVMRMLDATEREFPVDESRVYLTGLSYGGGLGYDVVHRNAGRFAAFVPVAARISIGWTTDNGSDPPGPVYAAVARALRDVPMWVFQGERDPNVPTTEVRAIVDALRQNGVHLTYTEIPGAGHAVWDDVYRRKELWDWLFAQRRKRS